MPAGRKLRACPCSASPNEFLSLPQEPLAVDEALSTHYLAASVQEAPWSRGRARRQGGFPPAWLRGAHGQRGALVAPQSPNTSRAEGCPDGARGGAADDTGVVAVQDETPQTATLGFAVAPPSDDEDVHAPSAALRSAASNVIACVASIEVGDEACEKKVVAVMVKEALRLALESSLQPFIALQQLERSLTEIGGAEWLTTGIRLNALKLMGEECLGCPARLHTKMDLAEQVRDIELVALTHIDEFLAKTKLDSYQSHLDDMKANVGFAGALKSADKTADSLAEALANFRRLQACGKACKVDIGALEADAEKLTAARAEEDQAEVDFGNAIDGCIAKRVGMGKHLAERYVHGTKTITNKTLSASEVFQKCSDRAKARRLEQEKIEGLRKEAIELEATLAKRKEQAGTEAQARKAQISAMEEDLQSYIQARHACQAEHEKLAAESQQLWGQMQEAIIGNVAFEKAEASEEAAKQAEGRQEEWIKVVQDLEGRCRFAQKRLEEQQARATTKRMLVKVRHAEMRCTVLQQEVALMEAQRERKAECVAELEAWLRDHGQQWQVDEQTGTITHRQPRPSVPVMLPRAYEAMAELRRQRALHVEQRRSRARRLAAVEAVAECPDCPTLESWGDGETRAEVIANAAWSGKEAMAEAARQPKAQAFWCRSMVRSDSAPACMQSLHGRDARSSRQEAPDLDDAACQEEAAASGFAGPEAERKRMGDAASASVGRDEADGVAKLQDMSPWRRHQLIWGALWRKCHLLFHGSKVSLHTGMTFFGDQLPEMLGRFRTVIADGVQCVGCLTKLEMVLDGVSAFGYNGQVRDPSSPWVNDLAEEVKKAKQLFVDTAAAMRNHQRIVASVLALLLVVSRRAADLQRRVAGSIEEGVATSTATQIILACPLSRPGRTQAEKTLIAEGREVCFHFTRLCADVQRLRADLNAILGPSGPLAAVEGRPLCNPRFVQAPRVIVELASSQLSTYDLEARMKLMDLRSCPSLGISIDVDSDDNEAEDMDDGTENYMDEANDEDIESDAIRQLRPKKEPSKSAPVLPNSLPVAGKPIQGATRHSIGTVPRRRSSASGGPRSMAGAERRGSDMGKVADQRITKATSRTLAAPKARSQKRSSTKSSTHGSVATEEQCRRSSASLLDNVSTSSKDVTTDAMVLQSSVDEEPGRRFSIERGMEDERGTIGAAKLGIDPTEDDPCDDRPRSLTMLGKSTAGGSSIARRSMHPQRTSSLENPEARQHEEPEEMLSEESDYATVAGRRKCSAAFEGDDRQHRPVEQATLACKPVTVHQPGRRDREVLEATATHLRSLLPRWTPFDMKDVQVGVASAIEPRLSSTSGTGKARLSPPPSPTSRTSPTSPDDSATKSSPSPAKEDQQGCEPLDSGARFQCHFPRGWRRLEDEDHGEGANGERSSMSLVETTPSRRKRAIGDRPEQPPDALLAGMCGQLDLDAEIEEAFPRPQTPWWIDAMMGRAMCTSTPAPSAVTTTCPIADHHVESRSSARSGGSHSPVAGDVPRQMPPSSQARILRPSPTSDSMWPTPQLLSNAGGVLPRLPASSSARPRTACPTGADPRLDSARVRVNQRQRPRTAMPDSMPVERDAVLPASTHRSSPSRKRPPSAQPSSPPRQSRRTNSPDPLGQEEQLRSPSPLDVEQPTTVECDAKVGGSRPRSPAGKKMDRAAEMFATAAAIVAGGLSDSEMLDIFARWRGGFSVRPQIAQPSVETLKGQTVTTDCRASNLMSETARSSIASAMRKNLATELPGASTVQPETARAETSAGRHTPAVELPRAFIGQPPTVRPSTATMGRQSLAAQPRRPPSAAEGRQCLAAEPHLAASAQVMAGLTPPQSFNWLPKAIGAETEEVPCSNARLPSTGGSSVLWRSYVEQTSAAAAVIAVAVEKRNRRTKSASNDAVKDVRPRSAAMLATKGARAVMAT